MPVQYQIRVGATVFSPDGKREWGYLPESLSSNVQLGSELVDKVIITYPLWEGKQFCVFIRDVITVTTGETPSGLDWSKVTVHVTYNGETREFVVKNV